MVKGEGELKGILFKLWKTKAIAESSPDFEWQTRRLGGLKEINREPDTWYQHYPESSSSSWWFVSAEKPVRITPRFQVGDVVYIKEKALYWEGGAGGCSDVAYQDDSEIEDLLKDNGLLASVREKMNKSEPIIGKWGWRSSLFMPEWAARYFIQITDVRAERLQEITFEDCLAEGIYYKKDAWYGENAFNLDVGFDISTEAFHYQWDSINPKYLWGSNPWVWRYGFQLVPKPVSPQRIK